MNQLHTQEYSEIVSDILLKKNIQVDITDDDQMHDLMLELDRSRFKGFTAIESTLLMVYNAMLQEDQFTLEETL
jgi:hypothetical protein